MSSSNEFSVGSTCHFFKNDEIHISVGFYSGTIFSIKTLSFEIKLEDGTIVEEYQEYCFHSFDEAKEGLKKAYTEIHSGYIESARKNYESEINDLKRVLAIVENVKDLA